MRASAALVLCLKSATICALSSSIAVSSFVASASSRPASIFSSALSRQRSLCVSFLLSLISVERLHVGTDRSQVRSTSSAQLHRKRELLFLGGIECAASVEDAGHRAWLPECGCPKDHRCSRSGSAALDLVHKFPGQN